jgi:putative dehydrogenase
MFQNRVLQIREGNYQLNSAVDILVKDLRIVLDAGRKQEFSLPVATAAHSIYRKASAKGLAVEDDSAAVKVYAAESGIELPPRKA